MNTPAKLKRDFQKRLVYALAVSLLSLPLGCSDNPTRVNSSQPAPASRSDTWENSLGMRFLPVPGLNTKMSIWETRVKDFEAFVEATGYDAAFDAWAFINERWAQHGISWADPGFDQTPFHPVTCVSWFDAVAFCDWLTQHERQNGRITSRQLYRLPTEQEWERAAGTQNLNPDRLDHPLEHYLGNFHPAAKRDPFDFTSPVGSFRPNQHGFHDLAGNVWEVLADDVGEELRLIRGGSWLNQSRQYASTFARGFCRPDLRSVLYGFRIVLAEDNEYAMLD